MYPHLVMTCAKGSLIGALLAAASASGQEAPQTGTDLVQIQRELEEQSEQLAAMQRALDEEKKKLLAHKRALQETRRQLEVLQARVGGVAAKPAVEKVAQADMTPRPVGQAPEKPEDSRPPEIAQLFEQPGVLTARGQFVLEPSVQYSYSSTNRVALVGYTIIPAIVIGLIDVQSVNRQTWTGAATARYGLTNRLEVEAKLPYVYRNDDSVTRPLGEGASMDSVFNATGNGIGDIEFGARYQLNEPRADGPYYVAGLRFKTRTGKDPFEVSYRQGSTPGSATLQEELPTGSGFYGIQPSLSVIYPSDPAVFFGGINYLWNIDRDVNRDILGQHVGKVEPGDAIGLNFGMGLALNERAAFSLGYEHTYIGRTKVDGAAPPSATATQLASLLLGYSYRVNNKTSVSLSLGAGLTRDTPDVQLTLRAPLSF
jgi:hypothetical protein